MFISLMTKQPLIRIVVGNFILMLKEIPSFNCE